MGPKRQILFSFISAQRIQQPQGKGNILTLSNYILNTQK